MGLERLGLQQRVEEDNDNENEIIAIDQDDSQIIDEQGSDDDENEE